MRDLAGGLMEKLKTLLASSPCLSHRARQLGCRTIKASSLPLRFQTRGEMTGAVAVMREAPIQASFSRSCPHARSWSGFPQCSPLSRPAAGKDRRGRRAFRSTRPEPLPFRRPDQRRLRSGRISRPCAARVYQAGLPLLPDNGRTPGAEGSSNSVPRMLAEKEQT
jgi:hypothetical protein